MTCRVFKPILTHCYTSDAKLVFELKNSEAAAMCRAFDKAAAAAAPKAPRASAAAAPSTDPDVSFVTAHLFNSNLPPPFHPPAAWGHSDGATCMHSHALRWVVHHACKFMQQLLAKHSATVRLMHPPCPCYCELLLSSPSGACKSVPHKGALLAGFSQNHSTPGSLVGCKFPCRSQLHSTSACGLPTCKPRVWLTGPQQSARQPMCRPFKGCVAGCRGGRQ